MRGPYLIRAPEKAALIAALDGVLALLPRAPSTVSDRPKSILVANWAHLGDVLMTLPVLSALRSRHPQAKIGVLVGSWSRDLIGKSGLADRIHMIDHWNLSRTKDGRLVKFWRYQTARPGIVREIKREDYEVGIDFYPYFPPAAPLFWAAGIPVRIGFTSGGFGPLLTHPRRWPDADRHIIDMQRELLNVLEFRNPFAKDALFPIYPSFTPQEVQALPPGPYVVLHPGTGASYKEWSEDNWIKVAAALKSAGSHTIVITGAGGREKERAERIVEAVPGAVNMVEKVGWEGFVSLLARASGLVCVDTVASHVASAFQVPTVVILTGVNKPSQWGPLNPHAKLLSHPVPCSPCHRMGCSLMHCISRIEPQEVLNALSSVLSDAENHKYGSSADK